MVIFYLVKLNSNNKGMRMGTTLSAALVYAAESAVKNLQHIKLAAKITELIQIALIRILLACQRHGRRIEAIIKYHIKNSSAD